MSPVQVRTANVVHWDRSRACVQCPYCGELHNHNIPPISRRLSHCGPMRGGVYELSLPVDETSGLVGYEIDKRRARFVDASWEGSKEEEEEDKDLADLFSTAMSVSAPSPASDRGLHLHNDAHEITTIVFDDGDTLKQKTILYAISDCVNGDVSAVRRYIETSSDAKVFLHGKQEYGDTTLILAAAERSDEMVSLLLQHGADANAINRDGRNALMEATLWGRVKTVKQLLNHNADKNLRDNEGRSALDLAQPTRQNQEQRDRRAPHLCEIVSDRDRDRRHIALLLEDNPIEKRRTYTNPLSKSQAVYYRFTKSESDRTITLSGPIGTLEVSSIYKTAAHLDRGEQFLSIKATSGWGPDSLPAPPALDTRFKWTDQVFYIASLVGHRLSEEPGKDHGKPGRYSACHAEKKLIAYFLDKHVFLPHDGEPDEELEDAILRCQESQFAMSELSEAWGEFCRLEKLEEDLETQIFQVIAKEEIEFVEGLGSLNLDAREEEVARFFEQPGNINSHVRKEQEEKEEEEELDRLRDKVSSIRRDRDILESDPHMVALRAEQNRENRLLWRKKVLERLMELSRDEQHHPALALRRATILSSNRVCHDCDGFVDRVNSHFGLHISLRWC